MDIYDCVKIHVDAILLMKKKMWIIFLQLRGPLIYAWGLVSHVFSLDITYTPDYVMKKHYCTFTYTCIETGNTWH